MKCSLRDKISILNHPCRPNSQSYIEKIFEDFIELSGDRISGDDPSIISGIALLDNKPVTVIGQQRGMNLEQQVKCNFSMTYPEGFRKSLRLMKQAEKFHRPVICFVDTIGAYPGVYAEENGQITAIANNIKEMMWLKTPIITILIGHGGSGGALALCAADRIAILENSVLSVISPQACAEILWKDRTKTLEATKLLKMTAIDLQHLGVIDYMIEEPFDGAQINIDEVSKKIKEYIIKELKELKRLPMSTLIYKRQKKYRLIGNK